MKLLAYDNFLKEIISNYDDHVRNIIYKLQKYSDTLLIELNSCGTPENDFNSNDKLISFLRCESDEILRNKILSTGIEIKFLLMSKYQNLIYKISMNDVKYKTVSSIYDYFTDMYKNINWDLMFYQSYCIGNNDRNSSVYQFTEAYDRFLDYYQKEFTDKNYHTIDKYVLIMKLETCYKTFLQSIETLIILMTTSLTSYKTADLMTSMLKCLAITYICVSNVDVAKE